MSGFLAVLFAVQAQAACPPEALALAASKYGYGPSANGKYCEGLLKEQHSVSMSVQVFQFVSVNESLRGATSIYVGIPPLSPNRVANVTARAAYMPYQFDATLESGSAVRFDLRRVVLQAQIPFESLGFLARARTRPTELVPVVLSGQARPPAPSEYLFAVRSNFQVIEVSYSVTDRAGAVRLEKKINHDFAPAEIIPLRIGRLPPGSYGLSVRTKQSQGDPAHDAVLYQSFSIP